MNENLLIQIDAPEFCGGAVIGQDGLVCKAAPKIKYMLGWTADRVRKYAEKKLWKYQNVALDKTLSSYS